MAQIELYAFTWAYTLTKDKTANIDIDSRYAFGAAHNFGILWGQCVFLTKQYALLTSRGKKSFKCLPSSLGIIKCDTFPWHFSYY